MWQAVSSRSGALLILVSFGPLEQFQEVLHTLKDAIAFDPERRERHTTIHVEVVALKRSDVSQNFIDETG